MNESTVSKWDCVISTAFAGTLLLLLFTTLVLPIVEDRISFMGLNPWKRVVELKEQVKRQDAYALAMMALRKVSSAPRISRKRSEG